MQVTSHARKILLITALLYIGVFAQLPFFTAQSAPPPSIDFSWLPRFAIIGNPVNFTATAVGGTPPYMYSWGFGDGQTGSGVSTVHSYIQPGTYAVNVTVSDSTNAKNSIVHSITIYNWPVRSYNWLIHWNTTQYNGLSISNVSYRGIPLIEDARMVASVVKYRDNLCGPFYDQPQTTDTQGVFNDGHVHYENFTGGADPYFQIRAEWRVAGYSYEEVFRFYKSGRWEPEVHIGRGGCAIDHIYEARWRIAFSMAGDATNNFMSQYTPGGNWQDLIWEGNYVDSGFRDPAHNATEWRIGNQGMFYYVVSNEVRADLDLPYIPPRIYLVRDHPNEFELNHFCGVLVCEDPIQFVNGELALRRDLAIWWIPRIWDHGPINGLPVPVKIATLSFYPAGVWP